MTPMVVRNVTRDTCLAQRAERATSFWRRALGLIGRREWTESDGLLIAPCQSVHTWFMRMPIDVVFVDKENVVRRVAHRLEPWRIGPISWTSYYVLELPAGTIAQTGTEPGDLLVLEDLPTLASSSFSAHPTAH